MVGQGAARRKHGVDPCRFSAAKPHSGLPAEAKTTHLSSSMHSLFFVSPKLSAAVKKGLKETAGDAMQLDWQLNCHLRLKRIEC